MLSNDLLKHLLDEEKRLSSEIESLKEALKSVQKLKSYYSSDNRSMKFNSSKRTSVADRVLDILKEIKKGTSSEIGEQLFKLYPFEYTLDKAKTYARVNLSRLCNDGKINSFETEGQKGFTYSVIDILEIVKK